MPDPEPDPDDSILCRGDCGDRTDAEDGYCDACRRLHAATDALREPVL